MIDADFYHEILYIDTVSNKIWLGYGQYDETRDMDTTYWEIEPTNSLFYKRVTGKLEDRYKVVHISTSPEIERQENNGMLTFH